MNKISDEQLTLIVKIRPREDMANIASELIEARMVIEYYANGGADLYNDDDFVESEGEVLSGKRARAYREKFK